MKELLKKKRAQLGTDWEEFKKFHSALPAPDKMTAEQAEELLKREKGLDKFEDEIKALESRLAADERMADREKRYSAPDIPPYRQSDFDGDRGAKDEKRQLEIFSKYLKQGLGVLNEKDVTEYTSLFRHKSMVAGQDVSGGYLVVPEKMAAGILMAADNSVFMRQLATVHTLTDAASLGVVNMDDDIDDYSWTAEIGTVSEDSGLTFGKRSLTPHPLRKLVKLSRTLVRKSSVPVEQLVQQRLAYKLGVTQEKHYMTGDGVNKPLGLFVASDSGIPTSRNKTLASATAITADELMDTQNMLKDSYQANARWLFHRDTITKLRKLKTTDLQYLWQPGLADNVPARILGKPYITSEYCPATMTAALYVGMYADFSYYWIVDALNMQLQVLNELYAANNQIGYIVSYEGDGAPVLSEAFARIITHA